MLCPDPPKLPSLYHNVTQIASWLLSTLQSPASQSEAWLEPLSFRGKIQVASLAWPGLEWRVKSEEWRDQTAAASGGGTDGGFECRNIVECSEQCWLTVQPLWGLPGQFIASRLARHHWGYWDVSPLVCPGLPAAWCLLSSNSTILHCTGRPLTEAMTEYDK